jgi:peptidoglycan/LPS O-acetylase OafA/YrhL
LDALRTCAVLFVICAHVREVYLHVGGQDNWFAGLPFVRGGWMGVDLFFVLSGYFIGKQLWRELQERRAIDFGRFFLRRGLRIWPLFAFFFVFALAVLGRGQFPFGKWWSDAIFLTNYLNKGVVAGSWSLCTEEQFYLVTPLLLIAFAPRIASIRQCRKFLWALLLALPVVRAVSWWALTGGLGHHDDQLFLRTLYEPIHSHADGLIMGLLLSNLEVAGDRQYRQGYFASAWNVFAAVVLCVVCQRVQQAALNFTGVTLVFGAVIWYLLVKRRPRLRFLDAVAFYTLSRLSYGMYLNHSYMQEAVTHWGLNLLPGAAHFPGVHLVLTVSSLVVLSAASAVVTFCLIEYPFLKLRARWLDRKKTARPEEGRPAAEPVVLATRAVVPAIGAQRTAAQDEPATAAGRVPASERPGRLAS